MIGTLRVLLSRENQRRDRLQSGASAMSSIESMDDLALTNETDKENLNFRYVL